MHFTLKAKLMLIVGLAGFAFLVMIITNGLLANKVEGELTTIRERYLPMLELGPRLEVEFERLQRSFQDAVAAKDKEALAETVVRKDQFLLQLHAARDFVDPAKVASLRSAVEDYSSAALNVSRRLISEETGETVVAAMTEMQVKQIRVIDILEEATTFDKRRLTEAFFLSTNAHVNARRIQLGISITCFLLVLSLSFWIGSDLLRGLRGLRAGLEKFGRGEFGQPIPVLSHDELGKVSQGANRMANRIMDLLKERESQSEALRKANGSLEAMNRELEAFSYSVAHDLRAPLRSMIGFSNALIEDYAPALSSEAKDLLERVAGAARKMGQLIDGLLGLSRLTRKEMTKVTVNLSVLTENIVSDLQKTEPRRKIILGIERDILAEGDPQLLQIALGNLLGNAWKFSSKRAEARIDFGATRSNGQVAYFVRDNGAGFDMRYADKLFGTFQRLHSTHEFEGTGIGLATVQRIVHRHGGTAWAESEPEHGATFYFTLGGKGAI